MPDQHLNPLSTNPTKWPNTLKQFVGKLPTNFFSVFDHFVISTLKGLRQKENMYISENTTNVKTILLLQIK